MKTPLTFIVFLLLTEQAALGFVVLPPAAGTNNLAALQANQIREASQRSYYSGRVDELQHRLDALDIELLLLAAAVGAAGAALVLLATRDRIWETRRVQEGQETVLRANK